MKRLVTTAALTLLAGTSHAIQVLPNGNLFDLGSYAAGTYILTGSGQIDLCGNGTFGMLPDGMPVTTVTCLRYGTDFNPAGSFTADGLWGRAGSNAKIGALIATLNPNAFSSNNPSSTQADDWFFVGYSATVTLPVAGHIYAAVNDTYYPNDTGAFNVTVHAVPETGSLALVAAGLGLLGRRRRQSSASSSA
ncbi:PEP-CTERM sorting domain-containing protein [Zoogloea sp.]|uniref:PEP-CTERM sorting domain-containing protein n=1 Tax=Zoogloea sp. TaxID=49181 RepID=UPI0035ADC84A